MQYIESIEKKKLILFHTIIKSVLELEDYLMQRDGKLSQNMAERMEQLYLQANEMMGQQFEEMDMIQVLEEILVLLKSKEDASELRFKGKQMMSSEAWDVEEGSRETQLFCSDDRYEVQKGCETYIETTVLQTPMKLPFLIRQSTNERILINRDIFKIGKEKSYVDYYIDNDAVSRSHADIIRRQDGFYVVDQNSLNHTFIEGKQIPTKQYVRLESGQNFWLANEEFTFYYERIQ